MRFWEPNRLFKTAILALFLMLHSTAAIKAQADSKNMLRERPPGQALSVFLAPTLLIGAGIATINDRGWYSSYDASECIRKNFPDFHTSVDDALMLVPAAAVYGLNWAGVKGKHNFTDRSLVFLSSLGLSLAASTLIKHTADIVRPDGSDMKSMPSNHAAIAFVSATFLHEEYKDLSIWYSIAGYSVATVTGVLRMLNNEHWMSDVLVGAGLGILMTKTMYWVYPAIKDRVSTRSGKKDKNQLSLTPYLSPGRSGSPGHYGLYLNYNIR